MDDLKEATKFMLRIALIGVACSLISIHWLLALIGVIVAIIVGAFLFPENSNPNNKEIEEAIKKINEPEQTFTTERSWVGDAIEDLMRKQQVEQLIKDNYELLKKNYPHGIDVYEKSHPGCSYTEVINNRAEVYNLEQEYKDQEKKIFQQKKETKEYDDLTKDYPHGIAEYKKLHPNHSWHDIWEHRTDVWRLEHDYKLKKHDELRERFPHGYESFMKENPQATIQEIIKNEDYLKTLEEECVNDEHIRKHNEVLKILEGLRLKNEWSNKNEEIVKRFFEIGFRQWGYLNGKFLYTWLFYYYPTTVNFDLSWRDEENRKTVWNFKNDPDRNISYYRHQRAVTEVLPNLQRNLIRMYGRDELKKLTCVCIPASTQVKNKARYEGFSKMLCEETGMENGYEHVHFIKDGISKNSTNNDTGTSIRPEVTFDDWFEGRFVVLFDDVVTKGESMLYYKNMLQKVGAIVVGGLCLGKTKHAPPITLPPLIVDNEEEESTGA